MESANNQPLDIVAGDPESSAAAVIPIATLATVLPVVSSPRFCKVCGAPWLVEWSACLVCDQDRRRVRPAITHEAETRSIRAAVLFYFVLLAVCIAATIARLAQARETSVMFAAEGVMAAIIFAWALVAWRDVLPTLTGTFNPVWLAAALGLSLATFALATGFLAALDNFLKLPKASMSQPLLQDGWGWGMVLLVVAVQPAVCEELAFRGVIFASLARALSAWETILVSACMFMVLHLSPLWFPHTLALGIASGYLRNRTKSLYPCILLHFSHNSLCVLMEWAGR